jgi:hypothetical protein
VWQVGQNGVEVGAGCGGVGGVEPVLELGHAESADRQVLPEGGDRVLAFNVTDAQGRAGGGVEGHDGAPCSG